MFPCLIGGTGRFLQPASAHLRQLRRGAAPASVNTPTVFLG